MKLWDVETGKEIYNLPHRVPVKTVEFAEGDKQFLVLTDNVMGSQSTVSIYNLNDTRRILYSNGPYHPHSNSLSSIEFNSPNNTHSGPSNHTALYPLTF